jgi:hypothetical protein
MKQIGVRHIAMLLSTAAVVGAGLMLAAMGRDRGNVPNTPVGVWYGTTYLGDPNDPNTLKLQSAIAFHSDRTMLLTASDHTGNHPFFPGKSTPGQGTWEYIQGGQIYFKFFEFNDGANPPATTSILKVAGVCSYDKDGRLVGTGGVEYVTCPNGPTGCISPNDAPFPPTDAFDFMLERLQ